MAAPMRQKTNSSFMAKDQCGCLIWVMVLAILFGSPAKALPLLGSGDAPAQDPALAGNAVPADTAAAKSNPPSSGTTAMATDAASIKSLFFTQEEMAAIHHAIAIYAKYAIRQHNTHEGEDFLKQLEGKGNAASAGPPKKYYTYPQFFLASLAYHSPGDWSVQINQERITSETKPEASGGLRVLKIDKDKVSLEWKPDDADIDKINALTNKVPGKLVDIDRANGIITFTLHANQTFSSYAMQVLEGKVQPVMVENAMAGNTIAMPDPIAEKAAPVSPENPVTPPASNQNGLKGLINNYNNLGQENNP